MNNYYVEGTGWFVVRTTSKRKAHSEGVNEYGRGNVRCVRLATTVEVKSYVAQKGHTALYADLNDNRTVRANAKQKEMKVTCKFVRRDGKSFTFKDANKMLVAMRACVMRRGFLPLISEIK